jgi:cytoskeletal protein CcmA (bactofilin family)
MLGIKKQPTVRSAIGAGMRVMGDCVFEDGLQIDGAVVGSVSAHGGQPSVLVVGESGSVEGAVSADHVVIAGTVLGPVLARELLELHAHARVQGDVRYKALEMQQGAVIAGQLQPQLTPPPAALDAGGAEPAGAPPAVPTEPTLDPDRL